MELEVAYSMLPELRAKARMHKRYMEAPITSPEELRREIMRATNNQRLADKAVAEYLLAEQHAKLGK